MVYRIILWRKINTNTGESLLVYLTNDFSDYLFHLDRLVQVFMDNSSYVKTSIHDSCCLRTAYIEYDLTKVKVEGPER